MKPSEFGIRAPRNVSLRAILTGLPFGLLLFSAWLMAMPLSTVVRAQAVAEPDPYAVAPDDPLSVILGLNSDRKTVQTWNEFHVRLRGGKFFEAGQLHDQLLLADPDQMIPTDDAGETFLPLYRVLLESVSSLSRDVRTKLVGGREVDANRLLQAAGRERSPEALLQVVQRYPGTEASLRACLMLAKLELDHGRRLAAVVWLTPVAVQDGFSEYRQMASARLKQLSIPGNPASLPGGTSSARDQSSGEVQRSPIDRSIPSETRWHFRDFASARLLQQISEFTQSCWKEQLTPQTSWMPVIREGVVYRRTLCGVAAIDARDGQVLWHAPQSEVPGSASAVRMIPGMIPFPGRNTGSGVSASQLDHSQIATVFCRDNVVPQLRLDDRNVYLVSAESGEIQTATRTISRNRFGGSHLIALDRGSGFRVWHLGDSTFSAELGQSATSGWIAGCQPGDRGQLHVVFEWNSEIRLGCVDGSSGQLLWSRLLCFPEQSIDRDLARRLRSATIRVHDGLILATTTSDWITCTDELTGSVLWTSRLRNSDRVVPSSAALRGRLFASAPLKSLNSRWTSEEAVIHGDSMIILPDDSHDILKLDLVSGRVLQRKSEAPSSTAAFLDRDALVIGTGRTLRQLSASDFSVRWSIELDEDVGIPAGRGVMRGQDLLLPTSLGAVVAVNRNDGAVVAKRAGLLPTASWGNLLDENATEGQRLFVTSPDRMLCLVNEPETHAPVDSWELAEDFAKTEQWEEVLRLTQAVPESDPDREAADRLRFRALVRLAEAAPDTYMERLTELAASDPERLSVRILEATAAVRRKDFGRAETELLNLLSQEPIHARNLSEFTVRLLLPERSAVWAALSDAERGVLSRAEPTLESWTAAMFSQLPAMKSISAEHAMHGQLTSLPVTRLLAIRHPDLRPLLVERIESSGSMEEAYHLMCHALALADRAGESRWSQRPAESSPEFQAFRKHPGHNSKEGDSVGDNADSLRQSTRQLLTTVLLLENSPEGSVLKSPHDSSGQSEESLTAEFQKRLKLRTSEWDEVALEPILVGRSVSDSRSRPMIFPVQSGDLFLRQYDWSVVPGKQSQVVMTDMTSPERRSWSLPGTFEAYGSFSNRSDYLQRSGSVVLLYNFRGITAVSVLDQRVLWSRQFRDPMVTSYIRASAGFEAYDWPAIRLPSQSSVSSFEVVGCGNRWICVHSAASIEMIDLLTGLTLWSVPNSSDIRRAVASESVVLLFLDGQEDALALDRHTGEPLQSQAYRSFAPKRVICSTGGQFVLWDGEDNAYSLTWRDDQTGEVKRKVPLQGFQRFQFVDDRTLCAAGNEAGLMLIDLRNGQHLDVPLKQPDESLHESERVVVAADGLHFYISRQPQQTINLLLPQLSSRQMLHCDQMITVLDRRTGDQLWSKPLLSPALASTDQPGLPVLMLIHSDKSGEQSPDSSGQLLFEGVSRTNGRTLFETMIPVSDSPRSVSLFSDKRLNMDIAVFGSYRFQIRPAVDR